LPPNLSTRRRVAAIFPDDYGFFKVEPHPPVRALLSERGETVQCGWLRDRFGVSWQIVPPSLVEMSKDADPAHTDRVTRALMRMIKLATAALKKAYGGGAEW
jgi:hypothetical protein